MNDINEMPPKCQYCPYWEVCEYPWVCPDREQLATNLQQTCNQLATDTINRQATIDALFSYLNGKKCPDDGTTVANLIKEYVIDKLPSI